MLFTLDHFIVIFTLYSHAYQILELRSRDILGNGQRHVFFIFSCGVLCLVKIEQLLALGEFPAIL